MSGVIEGMRVEKWTGEIFQGQIFSSGFAFPTVHVGLEVWLACPFVQFSPMFFSESLIQYLTLLFPIIATTICWAPTVSGRNGTRYFTYNIYQSHNPEK